MKNLVFSEDVKEIISSHKLSQDEKRIVDCVLAVYGNENGEFLSELTHNEKPWNATRRNLPEELGS